MSDEYTPHETMPENVYHWLCGLIEAGEFSVGERLDEVTLASRRGVSRTPLREAIRQLAAEGLVVHRPYAGNFIRDFTPQQVEDLYEFRTALELLAIRQVVRRRSPGEFDELRAIVDRCHHALDAGEMVAAETADREFHDWIASKSGNEMAIRTLNGLRLQIQLLRQVANQDGPFRDQTKEHRDGIVEALRRGDADEAAQLMAAHIGAVQVSAVRLLTDHPGS